MTAPTFHGLLIVEKPGGFTSRDVVNRAQCWFPSGTRIGHTGTLDPLATGVLVLCVGSATRLAEYVQRMDKTYRAGFLLGARSDTDDADGAIEEVPIGQPPDYEQVQRRLQEFVGEIEQVPPAFSAAKVTGQRAYDLARRGREVSLQPRPVHIHRIDTLAYEYPHMEIEVQCGKGTYIRSLARDLGARLGCGALVETLRRIAVGPFTAADALDPDADAATARSRLLPSAAALSNLPRVTIHAAEAGRLRRGQRIALAEVPSPAEVKDESSEVAVLDQKGDLVGVGVIDRRKRLLVPERILTVA